MRTSRFSPPVLLARIKLQPARLTDLSSCSDALSDAAEARFLALSRQAVGGARGSSRSTGPRRRRSSVGHLVPRRKGRSTGPHRLRHPAGREAHLRNGARSGFALAAAAAFGAFPPSRASATVSLLVIVTLSCSRALPLNDLNFQLESLATARSAPRRPLGTRRSAFPSRPTPRRRQHGPRAVFPAPHHARVTYAHRDEHGRPTFTLGPSRPRRFPPARSSSSSGNNGSGEVDAPCDPLGGLLAPGGGTRGRIEIDGVEPDLAGLRAHFSRSAHGHAPLFRDAARPRREPRTRTGMPGRRASRRALSLSHKVGLDGAGRFTDDGTVRAGERRRLGPPCVSGRV